MVIYDVENIPFLNSTPYNICISSYQAQSFFSHVHASLGASIGLHAQLDLQSDCFLKGSDMWIYDIFSGWEIFCQSNEKFVAI